MVRDLDTTHHTTLVLLALTATLSVAASQVFLGLGLVLLVYRWTRGESPAGTGLEGPALAFTLWALAMIPLSGDPQQSLLFSRRWYLLTAIWVAATLGGSRRWSLWTLGGLTLGAVYVSIYGVIKALKIGGAHIEKSGQLAGRAGMFQGYMTGAGLLMMVGLVLLAAFLILRNRRLQIVAGVSLAVVLVCLVMTMTRSAWLGFAAGSALVVGLCRGRWVLVLAAVGTVLIFFLPDVIQGRLMSAFDPANEANTQRVLMWETGWEWVAEHPITGVGDHDLKNLYREHHAGVEGVEIQGHLHSNLVQFAAIWGIPGLVLAVIFLLAVVVQLGRRWRFLKAMPNEGHDLARIWCLGALGAWVGFMVAGLFEWNFGDAEVGLLLWFLVGMALARLPEAAGNE